ncbi:MAG: hypothetical protein V5A57_02145 [Candidatus Paceibacterota bacterium]
MKKCFLLTHYNREENSKKKLGVITKESLEESSEENANPMDKLAELLNGFNDYTSGSILIGKENLKQADGERILELPGRLNNVKLPEGDNEIIINVERLDLFTVKALEEV